MTTPQKVKSTLRTENAQQEHSRESRYELDPECQKFLASKLDEMLGNSYKFTTRRLKRFASTALEKTFFANTLSVLHNSPISQGRTIFGKYRYSYFLELRAFDKCSRGRSEFNLNYLKITFLH